ncbi:MAG TPA: hypothetical protein VG795_05275 [Acidimicrobiia bacterium]|nr:hypothetical protein [Acidimicrobiia bacterium]
MKRFAVIATVVLAGILFVIVQTTRTSTDGPLDGGVGNEQGQPLEVRQPYTWGSTLLLNEGKKPATVERVRLLGVTGSFELLAVHTRAVPDERGQGLYFGDTGFPRSDYPSRPLAEQNVVPVPTTFSPEGNPYEGLQIVLGVQVNEPGVARFKAVEVTYTVGRRRYREVFHDSVYLCAPYDAYTGSGDCPSDEVRDRFDDRTLG